MPGTDGISLVGELVRRNVALAGNTADPPANGGDRKNHGDTQKSKGDGVFQKHCAIFIGGQAF
jgi:hypothetical protein